MVDDVEHTSEIMNSRYKYLKNIVDHYWRRFKNEYLLNLHEHHINAFKGNYDEFSRLILGDVVLIKDDASKRNQWKKGKVEKLIRGRDGHVRGALLKVCYDGRTSFLERPVQKIIPLEVRKVDKCSVGSSDVSDVSSKVDKCPVRSSDNTENNLSNISSKGRSRRNVDRFQCEW